MLLELGKSPALPAAKLCVLMPQPPGLQEEMLSPSLPGPQGHVQNPASGLGSSATRVRWQLARADV